MSKRSRPFLRSEIGLGGSLFSSSQEGRRKGKQEEGLGSPNRVADRNRATRKRDSGAGLLAGPPTQASVVPDSERGSGDTGREPCLVGKRHHESRHGHRDSIEHL